VSAAAKVVEHRLGPVGQIPVGEGRTFRVGQCEVAVFRLRGGGVAATQAECPHRGGPLADGIVGLDAVVCPLHAWRFSLPSGAAEVGDCEIAVHPCRLDERDDILLTLPAATTVSGT
jgi:nitrite reductase (NADH) small subunit